MRSLLVIISASTNTNRHSRESGNDKNISSHCSSGETAPSIHTAPAVCQIKLVIPLERYNKTDAFHHRSSETRKYYFHNSVRSEELSLINFFARTSPFCDGGASIWSTVYS